jgi:PAS domain S-box-containing protein/putative nucleotidyltransferase with HDIG domain
VETTIEHVPKHTKKILYGVKELSLTDSELRYRRLFETSQDGILILDAHLGTIIDVNPYLVNMLGYPRQEFLGKKLWEMGAFFDIKASQVSFEELQKNEYIRYEDMLLTSKSGSLIQVEFISNVYLVGDEKVIQCQIRDITERKLIQLALEKNEKKYYDLVNQSPEGVFIIELSGNILTVNTAMCNQLGYSQEEFLVLTIWDIIPDKYLDQYKISITKILEGNSLEEAAEYKIQGKDGKISYVEILSAPRYSGEDIIGFQGIARDITTRTASKEQIQRQVHYLSALSGIDKVIAANFDLELSLSQILNHIVKELSVDAADFLIFNPSRQLLEFYAARGFHSRVIRNTQLHLGESYAGRAAQQRQIIHISNLKTTTDTELFETIISEDSFISYFALPLQMKGEIKGVLEIFNRTLLEPDAEWYDFLNTLAGQASIAIEIATLFESLQHSNNELTLAYNATIEGWSHALDLRDKETEGHTRRVTELAMKLSRAFGLSEAELIQIRWGALLHDIGKMGVPDSILHKPGPLSEDEWVVMKKHPTFAYEMLAPIKYMRLALDIPYYHHEKWDGTGYPFGLIGPQIPLVARIFAVVDVWDALHSDRPYRSAWAEEKVREHIMNSSGTHFDPQVVNIFMQLPH